MVRRKAKGVPRCYVASMERLPAPPLPDWLARELPFERYRVSVGQDWGGPIGLRALADRRERLAGLVVLNTVVGPPRPGFKPTAFHRFARLPLVADGVFRLLGFPQNAMRFAQGDRGSIRGEVA